MGQRRFENLNVVQGIMGSDLTQGTCISIHFWFAGSTFWYSTVGKGTMFSLLFTENGTSLVFLALLLHDYKQISYF